MSSSYVRETVRAWCAALPIPFVDTVNREQNPAGPMWSTVVFVTADRQQADYCHGAQERGTFDFVVLCNGGTGDTDVIAAAEAALAQLMANKDPTGQLTLVQAGACEDFPQPGSARWFTVSATVQYLYVT